MTPTRYEICEVNEDGDEYYTGEWFYDYDMALFNLNKMNETDINKVYILKKTNIKRLDKC